MKWLVRGLAIWLVAACDVSLLAAVLRGVLSECQGRLSRNYLVVGFDT